MDILINYIGTMNIMMMSLTYDIYTNYYILQQQQPEHNINAETVVGSSLHLQYYLRENMIKLYRCKLLLSAINLSQLSTTLT
jgi:hypothetical protein